MSPQTADQDRDRGNSPNERWRGGNLRLPRQAARGLMWLTLARDSAGPDEVWIKESYNRAFAKASDDDRAMCLQMLEQWVQGRRE